jgi:uncharacterized membrane protein
MSLREKIFQKLSLSLLLEITSIIVLLGTFIWVGSNYSLLPAIIPVHYNSSGAADGFGAKFFVLIYPFISLLLFIVLTLIIRIPHRFNYAVEVKTQNLEQQYRLVTLFLRFAKLLGVLMFALLSRATIISAKTSNPTSIWPYLAGFLVLFSLGLFLYLIYAKKINRKDPV